MTPEKCVSETRPDVCMECWGDPANGDCWLQTQWSRCMKNDYWEKATTCEADGFEWIVHGFLGANVANTPRWSEVGSSAKTTQQLDCSASTPAAGAYKM
jgi:hypothetical protein